MKELLTKIERAQSFTAVKKVLKEHFPKTKKLVGSARIVVPLDENYVLKVAYNEKGISQNLNEHNIYTSTPNYYKRFLAKVKKADVVTGTWLIQERVLAPDRCEDLQNRFEQKHPKFFNIMDAFDLVKGDYDQVGHALNRNTYVLYDYGLTRTEYNRLYNW